MRRAVCCGRASDSPRDGCVRCMFGPHTEGVVRPPSSLTMTVGLSPSMMATTEFVVPRSIPMQGQHDLASFPDIVLGVFAWWLLDLFIKISTFCDIYKVGTF